MAKYTTPTWQDGTSPAINAANLLALGYAVEETQCPYAVCATAAGTTAKTATISLSGTLSLYTGLTVRIKFTYGNTAGNPTLNVNGTGAKAIRSFGTTAVPNFSAGKILTLTYDGSGWLVSGSGVESNDAKIATGSYTGTGVYGMSNPNTLTFSFTPKIVFIRKAPDSTTNGYAGTHDAFAVFSQTASNVSEDYSATSSGNAGGFAGTLYIPSNTYPFAYRLKGKLVSKTLTWCNLESAKYQANTDGETYYWTAIG